MSGVNGRANDEMVCVDGVRRWTWELGTRREAIERWGDGIGRERNARCADAEDRSDQMTDDRQETEKADGQRMRAQRTTSAVQSEMEW